MQVLGEELGSGRDGGEECAPSLFVIAPKRLGKLVGNR